MSGIESIYHANGVYGDSPGSHPGTSRSHVFRPNGADGMRVVGISTPTASTAIARGTTPGRSRDTKFRPNGAAGIPTPTASTAIARGATPGRSRFAIFRPNGAAGTRVTHCRSEQPAVPCAPLGRGIPVAHDSRVSTLARVSPFAITAYPVGDANCVGDENCIVSLIVEMIEPYQGRVYDPAMGSGGFFHLFHANGVYGDSEGWRNAEPWTGQRPVFHPQTSRAPKGRSSSNDRHSPFIPSNPTTWRLAAMNMAIRGIDFDFGKEPADTFTRNQHPDLRINGLTSHKKRYRAKERKLVASCPDHIGASPQSLTHCVQTEKISRSFSGLFLQDDPFQPDVDGLKLRCGAPGRLSAKRN